MAVTVTELEKFVGSMMRKHPEIVPLVEKVQSEVWIMGLDYTYKRSSQHNLSMIVDIDEQTLRFQFGSD